MASANVVILMGNLGSDPEIRYTQSQTPVCSLSVATTKKIGDSDRVDWHKVKAWGKLAHACGDHLKKGDKVYVQGELTNRTWQDSNGKKQTSTEVNAIVVQFMPKQYNPQQSTESSPEGFADIPV